VEWWLVALSATLLAFTGLLLLPFRIDLSFEARGEPSGSWAIAGGGAGGPFGVTGVLAREVPLTLQVRVLGWTVKTLQPTGKKPLSLQEAARDIEKARGRADWLSIGHWLIGEQKRLELERLDIELEYSFENVVLTGQIIAATSIVAGFMPPPVRLRSAPSWDLVDKAALSVDGRLKVWPGLFLVDALRFLAKNRRVFKRRAET
jgi:hypothetical protein